MQTVRKFKEKYEHGQKHFLPAGGGIEQNPRVLEPSSSFLRHEAYFHNSPWTHCPVLSPMRKRSKEKRTYAIKCDSRFKYILNSYSFHTLGNHLIMCLFCKRVKLFR